MATRRGRGCGLLGEWLEANGVPRGQFAESIGVSRVTLWRFLSGERVPSVDVAVAICNATNGAVPVASWANVRRAA